MRSFLLLYDAPSDDTGPLDPATLSPAEHYLETTWNGSGHWTNGQTAGVFDTRTSGITATTVNSLKAYVSNGTTTQILRSLSSTPIALQFADTETWITYYMVFAVSAGAPVNRYPFWMAETGGDEHFGFHNADGTVGFWWRDVSNRAATQVTPAAVSDGNPRVYAWRVNNVTNAVVADLWVNGTKNTTVSTNPMTKIANTSTPNLFNTVIANNAFQGTWCELIQFKAEHTDGQIERVTTFLKSKWGIT